MPRIQNGFNANINKNLHSLQLQDFNTVSSNCTIHKSEVVLLHVIKQ